MKKNNMNWPLEVKPNILSFILSDEEITKEFKNDIKKYIKSNDLLYIEEKEYESKIINIFVFYSYNQFDIWVLLFKSLKTFTYSLIAEETGNMLILTNNYINNYLVTNALGQQIMSGTQTSLPLQINGDKLPEGIYYLSIQTNAGIKTFKLKR